MNPGLARAVLAAHLVVIVFNVFGLIAVPLGARFGWRWVRIRWWRALHLAALAVVALQALFGRACFLTIWQAELEGAGPAQPLIERWIDGLVYWPLPIWVFTVGYLLIFAYAIGLWVWIGPEKRPNAEPSTGEKP